MKQFNGGASRSRRMAAGMAAGAAILTVVAVGAAWTPARAAGVGTAVATPDNHLKDGDVVSVALGGFPANTMVVGVECDEQLLATGDNGYCDITNVAIVTTDADGAANATITVHSGSAFTSTNGQGKCDAQTPCVIAFTTPTLPDATNAVAPIAFGSTTHTDAGSATRTVKAGKAVTFTVTVSSDTEGVPTGSISVRDGKNELTTKTLAESGEVTVKVKLAPGKHKIKVHYSGDTAYLGSSDSVAVTVRSKH